MVKIIEDPSKKHVKNPMFLLVALFFPLVLRREKESK